MIKIELVEIPEDVYDITVSDNHNFYANDILVHNCSEILSPVKGYKSVEELYKEEDVDSEISLCSLGAIVAKNTSFGEYLIVAYYTLLMIDNVIDLMDYPFPNLKYTATRRRNVGVGITNLAHLMASKGLKYTSKEGKQFIHDYAELHSYSLHRASLQLAKEKGNCEWIDKTKYPSGWLPIDTYNKNIDSVIPNNLKQDWESLRAAIIEQGGIRHSVLEAYMPNESSSVATNSTNSIYPIRGLKIVKTSGKKKNVFLAPDAEELADAYENAWDIPTKDMIELYAIVQKFTGQAISADLYVDFNKFPNHVIDTTTLIKDFLYMSKLGMKTRYYVNTKTYKVQINESVEEIEDSDCESCKL